MIKEAKMLIMSKPHAEMQKLLNQWRHKYDLNIFTIVPDPSDPACTYCALVRAERPNDSN